jgi:hypothetical protein
MVTGWRRSWLIPALAGGGVLFQLLPGSCAQALAIQTVTAFNFCSVLNCDTGQFFDFCRPVALFIDCFAQATSSP